MAQHHSKDLEFCCHTGPAAQASKLFGRNATSRADSSDSSVFTVQLWKAAGLTPKLLGKKGRPVLRDLAPPNARNGLSKHLARAALSGAGFSSGSLSAICCELNPKTLKAAAMQAYEASAVEEASAAQLSGSTGHSPAPRGGAEPISSGPEASNTLSRPRPEVLSLEAAQAAQQKQVHHLARQLMRCNSQGQAAPWGPGIAPDARGCLICGVSCSIYVTVPGISAPLAQPLLPPQDTLTPEAAPAMPAVTVPAAGQGAQAVPSAPQPAADAGIVRAASPVGVMAPAGASVSTPRALQPASSTVLPQLAGPPPLIGCSQCRKPMHLDCFVAHYNVVPARRDFTYCPAHTYVPKPKPPGGKSHHKRERNSIGEPVEKKKKHRVERAPAPPASVEVDDGDGDYVPRATTMRLRGTSPPPPTSRRSSQSARLRTRGSLTPTREGNSPMAGPSQAPATDRDMMEVSEEGGEKAEPGTEPRKANQSDPAPNSGPESRSGSPIDTPPTEPKMPEVWLPAANAQPGSPLAAAAEPSASEGLALPERSILPRVRIPKNQRSARTSRGNTAPAVVLTQGGVTSRVALPPPFSSPAPSPKALDKEQPSADRQCPVSPTAGAGDASSGTPRSSAPAATTPSASGHAPSASAETAAPISRAAVSAASAQLPKVEPGRRREPHISSPRANQPAVESKPAVAPGGKAVNGPQSPKKGGAQDGAKSSVKSPRHCSGDAPQSKGEKAASRTAAWGTLSASSLESPVALALAQGSADLKDEELARLLHEELNAPSRRRAKRLPDVFSTPPLSTLGIDRALLSGGSVKKSLLERNSSASATPSSGVPLGSSAAARENGRGPSKNPNAA